MWRNLAGRCSGETGCGFLKTADHRALLSDVHSWDEEPTRHWHITTDVPGSIDFAAMVIP